MTQITKSTMIGELLQIDQNIAPILFKYWNALPWMPVFPDGDSRRGCHGTRYRSGRSGKRDNDFLAKDLA